MIRAALLAITTMLLVAAQPPALAWAGDPPAPHHADLAEQAAARLPAWQRDWIAAHRDAFRAGALAPDVDVDPFFHRYDPAHPDWGGAATAAADAHAAAALALREGRAEDAAFRLGFLTHFPLDVAQPMHSGGERAIASRWHVEYEDTAWARAATLDLAAGPVARGEPRALTIAAAQAGAAHWPALDDALRRANASWSEEIAQITDGTLGAGLAHASGALYQAFVDAGATPPWPAERIDPEVRRLAA